MAQPCPRVEPSTAKTEHSHFSSFYLCQSELWRHTGEWKITLTIPDTDFFFIGAAHCSLIFSVTATASQIVFGWSFKLTTIHYAAGWGGGFFFGGLGWLGKEEGGELWSGEDEWAFSLSAFTPTRRVVLAILNLIALLAGSWILTGLINGIPGMQ